MNTSDNFNNPGSNDETPAESQRSEPDQLESLIPASKDVVPEPASDIGENSASETQITDPPARDTPLSGDAESEDQADKEQLQTDLKGSRYELALAGKYLGLGLLIGTLIAGTGYVRTHSAQKALADSLVSRDHCGPSSSIPSGFCMNSGVSVALYSSSPLGEITGSFGSATISATRARIGIFGDANLNLKLTGLSPVSSGLAMLSNSEAGSLTGTLSMNYANLTHTLQNGSNNGASIFYAGQNEIGTSNDIPYQGQTIPLVVISRIELKNGKLFLTPLTVKALGRSAPASSVFTSVAPVPVAIPTMPKNVSYTTLETTKNQLIFNFSGKHVPLTQLFSAH